MIDFRGRPTRDEDLDWILRLETAEREAGWIKGSTRDQHRAWFGDPNIAHVVFEQDGDAVGYAILRGLLSPDRDIELKRVVVETKGKGHGRAAIRWCRHFAFAEHGAHRLWLDTYEHNVRAQGLYESEGFVREGLLREAARTDSGYVSLVIYSLLASDAG
ncbi:GNAT family N-acetyltransferase [Roseiterribacter gracilis]|uniref:N-acetyltransferase n=1 Tax=Roseiterribacter gracilis TaxID=2812848 RepID=A0A8S8XB06_9PROT|nr:N-acetyltransferase [Rhodospirillales bacterium TMPK1]